MTFHINLNFKRANILHMCTTVCFTVPSQYIIALKVVLHKYNKAGLTRFYPVQQSDMSQVVMAMRTWFPAIWSSYDASCLVLFCNLKQKIGKNR